MYLAEISCPNAFAWMAELSLWTRFSEVSVEHMLLTAYLDACATFFFASWLLQSHFLLVKIPSEKDPMEWKFLCKKKSYKRHTCIEDSTWLTAFALLAPASLGSTSWCGLCQQPDCWAPYWLGAHARAPGDCLWSIKTRRPNSAVSYT
jgi:hypothetical protein